MKLDPEERDSPPPPFRQLGAVLGRAADIARELSSDRHLPRLLRVFIQLPPPDREPILGILEREVAARRASVAAGDGLVGPPNCLGTIYIRIFENDDEMPPISRDDMARSTMEATALMADFPEAMRVETDSALFAALDVLSDAEAESLARVHDDVVAILEAFRP